MNLVYYFFPYIYICKWDTLSAAGDFVPTICSSCFFQILFLLKFIRQFLEDNPFSVCSEELTYIKKHIVSEGDKIVTKSKAGVIVITVNQDNYFMKLRFSIPDAYPSDPVT